MTDHPRLLEKLKAYFADKVTSYSMQKGQLAMELPSENLIEICTALRDTPDFAFDMMIDLCGVDYSAYGLDEWKTDKATLSGFSRGVMSHPRSVQVKYPPCGRFAVVYQLLSIKHNHRVRLKVFVDQQTMMIDSIFPIWESANWYEREAFDLFGILFKGHPDLRRILTDYGFIGHPFRKDFPIIGEVEMRYDATSQRCIYEPVSVIPRTLVPKVIREDHRYLITEEEGISHA